MTLRATAASTSDTAIVIACDLPHGPAKVWRTLTEPDLLAKWLMPNDIRAKIGHRFTFDPKPVKDWTGGIVRCEVLAVEPRRLLRYAWRGGAPGPDGDGQPIDTVVTWTLLPFDTGTRLLLVHDGFPADGAALAAMRGGWTRLVTGCLVGLLAREPSI